MSSSSSQARRRARRASLAVRSGDAAAAGGDSGDGGERDKGGGGSKFPGSPASEGEIEDPEVIIARRNAEHRRMQARAREGVDDKNILRGGAGEDGPTHTCGPRHTGTERYTRHSWEVRRMLCALAMMKVPVVEVLLRRSATWQGKNEGRTPRKSNTRCSQTAHAIFSSRNGMLRPIVFQAKLRQKRRKETRLEVERLRALEEKAEVRLQSLIACCTRVPMQIMTLESQKIDLLVGGGSCSTRQTRQNAVIRRIRLQSKQQLEWRVICSRACLLAGRT